MFELGLFIFDVNHHFLELLLSFLVFLEDLFYSFLYFFLLLFQHFILLNQFFYDLIFLLDDLLICGLDFL